jgi:hypothetical protein
VPAARSRLFLRSRARRWSALRHPIEKSEFSDLHRALLSGLISDYDAVGAGHAQPCVVAHSLLVASSCKLMARYMWYCYYSCSC